MIAIHRRACAVWLLAALLAMAFGPGHAAQARPRVAVVAFGLFGDQNVFESEAKGAAQIVAGKLGGDPVVVRFNTKTGADATPETLAAALQSAATSLDAEHDVLLVILTSHGSRAGVAVKAQSRQAILSPLDLFTMLDATHVRHRIVIVSACYSGVFIPPLADPDTLVITAADADHPSFGCQNGATWTYFGDAFFNMALRRTANLRDAFALASTAVRKRETQNHFEPSNPQIAGGENVERALRGETESDAAGLDSRYAPAFDGRGNAYSGKGDSAHAFAAYDRAIKLDPKFALAYADRAMAYRARGDLVQALADSEQAVMLDPALPTAYNARATAYFFKGDKDGALADFNEAIRLDPKRYLLYGNRGVVFASKGDNDHAIADFTAALKIEPRFYIAYYQRGMAYGAKGDSNRAIADFNQAIKLVPNFADAFNQRSLAYRAKGDAARADADLKEAARLKAGNAAN